MGEDGEKEGRHRLPRLMPDRSKANPTADDNGDDEPDAKGRSARKQDEVEHVGLNWIAKPRPRKGASERVDFGRRCVPPSHEPCGTSAREMADQMRGLLSL